jgi:hypothetical protein
MLLKALLVSIAFVVLDVAWARYMTCIAEKRVRGAVLWSAAISLLAGFSVIQYVDDNWMLIPATLGGAVGTWVGMKIK